jgi:hypothetical protein
MIGRGRCGLPLPTDVRLIDCHHILYFVYAGMGFVFLLAISLADNG